MKKQRWVFTIKEVSNDYVLCSPDGKIKDSTTVFYTLNEKKARQKMEEFPQAEGWHLELWKHPLGVDETNEVHGPYSTLIDSRYCEKPEEEDEEMLYRYIMIGRRKGSKEVDVIVYSHDQEFNKDFIDELKEQGWCSMKLIDVATATGEEIGY